jgi:hypothetical protein
MVDQGVVDRFVGVLKGILDLELQAGNKIVETYESKDSTFPMPNATMIFLEKPFRTPIQREFKNIEFRNINDPHYWKAEYFDKDNTQFLCCGFDGVDFREI